MSQLAFAFSKPLAGRMDDGAMCAVLAYSEFVDKGNDYLLIVGPDDRNEYLLIVDISGRMVWVPMSEVTIRDAETVFIG